MTPFSKFGGWDPSLKEVGLLSAALLVVSLASYSWGRRSRDQPKELTNYWAVTTALGHAREMKIWPQNVPAPPYETLHMFCPTCRRACQLVSRPRVQKSLTRRLPYAYCALLFGENPDYFLGAMVLGYSIMLSKSPHDRVLLHTHDVPQEFLALLGQVWILHPVTHLECDKASLYSPWAFRQPRFSHVFTKLHVLNLVVYEKVLMLDLDILINTNCDHLFKLQAPAAMRRGHQSFTKKHGEMVNGTLFFCSTLSESGEDGVWQRWNQMNGINAGVMLLPPHSDLFDRVSQEIIDPAHPEHIPCAGPEQDYLSRLFVDTWHHIDVSYNFQLHHLYYYLDGEGGNRTEMSQESMRIIHYSGDEHRLKPWVYKLDSYAYRSQVSEDEFIQRCCWEYSRNANYTRVYNPEKGTTELRIPNLQEYAYEDQRIPKDFLPEVVNRADSFVGFAMQRWFQVCDLMVKDLCPQIYQVIKEWKLGKSKNKRQCAECGTPALDRIPQMPPFCRKCVETRWRYKYIAINGSAQVPNYVEEDIFAKVDWHAIYQGLAGRSFDQSSGESLVLDQEVDDEIAGLDLTGTIYKVKSDLRLCVYHEDGSYSQYKYCFSQSSEDDIWWQVVDKYQNGPRSIHWVLSASERVEEAPKDLQKVSCPPLPASKNLIGYPSDSYMLAGRKAGAGLIIAAQLICVISELWPTWELKFTLKTPAVLPTNGLPLLETEENLIFLSPFQDDEAPQFPGCPNLLVTTFGEDTYLTLKYAVLREGQLQKGCLTTREGGCLRANTEYTVDVQNLGSEIRLTSTYAGQTYRVSQPSEASDASFHNVGAWLGAPHEAADPARCYRVSECVIHKLRD